MKRQFQSYETPLLFQLHTRILYSGTYSIVVVYCHIFGSLLLFSQCKRAVLRYEPTWLPFKAWHVKGVNLRNLETCETLKFLLLIETKHRQ